MLTKEFIISSHFEKAYAMQTVTVKVKRQLQGRLEGRIISVTLYL